MRKWHLCVVLAVLCGLPGCASWPFDLFSDYYSAGGTSDQEKRRHYDEQVARWSNHSQSR